MPSSKSKGKKAKLLRPGLLVLAVMFLWAAQNEPANFTASTFASWALGALTVALLTRAGLALVAPVFAIAGTLLTQAMQEHPHGVEEP
jgi:hypothetical protein